MQTLYALEIGGGEAQHVDAQSKAYCKPQCGTPWKFSIIVNHDAILPVFI